MAWSKIPTRFIDMCFKNKSKTFRLFVIAFSFLLSFFLGLYGLYDQEFKPITIELGPSLEHFCSFFGISNQTNPFLILSLAWFLLILFFGLLYFLYGKYGAKFLFFSLLVSYVSASFLDVYKRFVTGTSLLFDKFGVRVFWNAPTPETELFISDPSSIEKHILLMQEVMKAKANSQGQTCQFLDFDTNSAVSLIIESKCATWEDVNLVLRPRLINAVDLSPMGWSDWASVGYQNCAELIHHGASFAWDHKWSFLIGIAMVCIGSYLFFSLNAGASPPNPQTVQLAVADGRHGVVTQDIKQLTSKVNELSDVQDNIKKILLEKLQNGAFDSDATREMAVELALTLGGAGIDVESVNAAIKGGSELVPAPPKN